MRRLLIAAAIALTATAAGARVAPLTPEQALKLDRQRALEKAFRDRFSDPLFNRLRDMQASVIVSTERGGRPRAPRALVKDERGWAELVGAGRRPVDRRVAHELDRLLIDPRVYAEPSYAPVAACAAPTVFVLRYAGREAYGRQCAPAGLSGRAALAASSLRVPAGTARTTAPPPTPEEAALSLGPQEDITSHIGLRAQEMVWAWDRRSLAAAVDPYADDVLVEFADGQVLRGRTALADWMRRQQDWAQPGVPFDGRTLGVRYHRGTVKAPEGDFVTELREVRWEADGKPLRRTYAAIWQNRGGLWQIVRERVSAVKPGTDDRIAW